MTTVLTIAGVVAYGVVAALVWFVQAVADNNQDSLRAFLRSVFWPLALARLALRRLRRR